VLRIVIATLVFLLSASLAQAAVCTVDVGDLNFSEVDTLGSTPAAISSDITIECDSITPQTSSITVCGNLGEGGGGTVGGVRQSLSAGGSLGFVLYATSGQTTQWGTVTTPEFGDPRRIDVPVTGTSASLTVTLHGVIPTGQSTAPVGDYRSDFAPTDSVFTYAEGNLDCAAPSGGTDAFAPFSVVASVPANCLLETSDLDFGTTGVIGSNIDADTAFDLTCTSGTDYEISIDGGGAGDPDNRVLRAGSNTVRYDLYSDHQRTDRWGTAAGSIVDGDGDGTVQTYDVYGRIPPQPAAAGAYSDTVVVTIAY
jgi:spore coat protein U-like protein